MERAQKSDATRKRVIEGCYRKLMVAACLLLAGCASTGKAPVKPAVPPPPAAAQPAPSLPTGPAVVHYADGREGFRITEGGRLDREVRADFDQAGALIREAKHDQAVALLEKVVARAPERSAPRINLAIAYGKLNRPEQAEQHLKKALELIPGHPVASNEYGLLLRKAGRFAESRLVYEKSLSLFPEYHPIHRNMAILCDLYLKDLACAAEHYEAYAKSVPAEPKVKLWLADLQTRRPVAAAGK